MAAKRWQDSRAFVDALVKRGYLKRGEAGNVQKFMPEGAYLYMWEIWKDALDFCDCCEHGFESGCCLDCSSAGPP